jgi:hypothetical protein
MDALPNELITLILNYLNDIDKVHFLSVSKRISHNYVHIKINRRIDAASAMMHRYTNSFTNIRADIESASKFHSISTLTVAFLEADQFKLVPPSVTNLTIGLHNEPWDDVAIKKWSSWFLPSDIPIKPIKLQLNGITHLAFGSWFNLPVTIPQGCTHLVMGDRYNRSLINFGGETLTHLTFGRDFNQYVDLLGRTYLPASLKHLTFGYNYDQEIYSLPNNIKHLTFGHKFDQRIDQCLPSSLVSLTFGHSFNTSINMCLPYGIRYLKFGYTYNKPISDCIPESVRVLIFGDSFDQSINKIMVRIYRPEEDYDDLSYTRWQHRDDMFIGIPRNVTYLMFGEAFNQHIDGCIPNSVKHLKFGNSFNKSIDSLPDSITHLKLGYNFNQYILKLPLNLTRLTLGGYNKPLDCLPDGLKILNLGNSFNCPIEGSIPNSVTHLTFGREFDQEIRRPFQDSTYSKPFVLKYLKFGENYNSISIIPYTVTHLVFGFEFNQDITIPSKCTHITFGYAFNRPIDDLPPSITDPVLGYKFNQPIKHLPLKLNSLICGNQFDQPITVPDGLYCLTLGRNFNHKITDQLIPSVRKLFIHKNYKHKLSLNKKIEVIRYY